MFTFCSTQPPPLKSSSPPPLDPEPLPSSSPPQSSRRVLVESGIAMGAGGRTDVDFSTEWPRPERCASSFTMVGAPAEAEVRRGAAAGDAAGTPPSMSSPSEGRPAVPAPVSSLDTLGTTVGLLTMRVGCLVGAAFG
jgi:hypothetical protein